MKKRRLKKWVKITIEIIIMILIAITITKILTTRVEFFNNNIEKCGNNYC